MEEKIGGICRDENALRSVIPQLWNTQKARSQYAILAKMAEVDSDHDDACLDPALEAEVLTEAFASKKRVAKRAAKKLRRGQIRAVDPLRYVLVLANMEAMGWLVAPLSNLDFPADDGEWGIGRVNDRGEFSNVAQLWNTQTVDAKVLHRYPVECTLPQWQVHQTFDAWNRWLTDYKKPSTTQLTHMGDTLIDADDILLKRRKEEWEFYTPLLA